MQALPLNKIAYTAHFKFYLDTYVSSIVRLVLTQHLPHEIAVMAIRIIGYTALCLTRGGPPFPFYYDYNRNLRFLIIKHFPQEDTAKNQAEPGFQDGEPESEVVLYTSQLLHYSTSSEFLWHIFSMKQPLSFPDGYKDARVFFMIICSKFYGRI